MHIISCDRAQDCGIDSWTEKRVSGDVICMDRQISTIYNGINSSTIFRPGNMLPLLKLRARIFRRRTAHRKKKC